MKADGIDVASGSKTFSFFSINSSHRKLIGMWTLVNEDDVFELTWDGVGGKLTAELLILRKTSFVLDFVPDDDPSGDSSSTHLFASFGPWHTAVIRSINGPLTSNAFLMVSVSSKRFTLIPVNGNFPCLKEEYRLVIICFEPSNRGDRIYLVNERAHSLTNTQYEQSLWKQYEISISMIRTNSHAAHVNDITQRSQLLSLPIPNWPSQYL